jgi:hypothetical protein
MKNLKDTVGIKPGAFRLVAQCLNQLRFCVSPNVLVKGKGKCSPLQAKAASLTFYHPSQIHLNSKIDSKIICYSS